MKETGGGGDGRRDEREQREQSKFVRKEKMFWLCEVGERERCSLQHAVRRNHLYTLRSQLNLAQWVTGCVFVVSVVAHLPQRALLP